jgi:hypothetical protein
MSSASFKEFSTRETKADCAPLLRLHGKLHAHGTFHLSPSALVELCLYQASIATFALRFSMTRAITTSDDHYAPSNMSRAAITPISNPSSTLTPLLSIEQRANPHAVPRGQPIPQADQPYPHAARTSLPAKTEHPQSAPRYRDSRPQASGRWGVR